MPNVLIIDDEEVKRGGIADQVELLGHEILTAENGLEGLIVARNRDPDVILLDLNMPIMNGVEFLEEAKADSALREIPIIVITGQNSSESSVAECIEKGAIDFLKMPPEFGILKARINSSLERRQLQRSQAKMQKRVEALFLQVREAEERADQLLHAIFPHEKVQELRKTDDIKPTRHEDVAVMFCDIVGFTSFCDQREPEDVLGPLQVLTESFEQCAEDYDLEKIKTIGDCFMATSSLLKPSPDSLLKCVKCGVEFTRMTDQMKLPWQVRVGIHSGPLISGKLGRKKFLFDVWGTTVNIAARVEGMGQPGYVTVTEEVWNAISDDCQGHSIGTKDLKGIGERELFQIDSVE